MLSEEGDQGETGRTGSSRSQSKDSSWIAAFQVQFEEQEDTKACIITINDDAVFEGTESFSVELSMPAYALLGNVTRATITIADPEDEPTLQFDRSTFHVTESAGFLSAPVQRKGGQDKVLRPTGGTPTEREPSWQRESLWALPAYGFRVFSDVLEEVPWHNCNGKQCTGQCCLFF